MKLIEWINGVTKLSKTTMDTFQTNIKTAFDDILNGTSNIKYDNTASGLESQTVKEAIDELAEGTNASASDVSYDNKTSGLTSTNIQGAIDELLPVTITNDNGTAIKFADGTMICTKQISFSNVNFPTQSGNLYFSQTLSFGSTPENFISTPKVFMNVSAGWGLMAGVRYYSGTSFGQTQLFRGDNTTQTTVTIEVMAIGRWK